MTRQVFFTEKKEVARMAPYCPLPAHNSCGQKHCLL